MSCPLPPPPYFFIPTVCVMNQGSSGKNTLCKMQRSLIPTVFPNLQSSQSLQEARPAEVRTQTNGNDFSSVLIFWPDSEEHVNALLHLKKTPGLSDSY